MVDTAFGMTTRWSRRRLRHGDGDDGDGDDDDDDGDDDDGDDDDGDVDDAASRRLNPLLALS